MMMSHHLGEDCGGGAPSFEIIEIFWRLLGECSGSVTFFGELVKPKKKNKKDQKMKTRINSELQDYNVCEQEKNKQYVTAG